MAQNVVCSFSSTKKNWQSFTHFNYYADQQAHVYYSLTTSLITCHSQLPITGYYCTRTFTAILETLPTFAFFLHVSYMFIVNIKVLNLQLLGLGQKADFSESV